MNDEPEHFSNPAVVHPDMTEDEWSGLTARLLHEAIELTDDEDDAERGHVHGGLLRLVEQGCTYYNALVLNGEFTGRVVNHNEDLFKPSFAFERNFLDWYERWLDEIISGSLLQDQPTWFGFTARGENADYDN